MKRLPFPLSVSALWALIAIAPLFFLYLLVNFFFQWQHLNYLDQETERIRRKVSLQALTKSDDTELQASLKNADPHYLDKYVETLTFLLPEIKRLEAIHNESPDDEQIFKRLHFLKEGENRLLFSEEQIRSNELFREIEEKQQSPIELNEEDLKKLLCLLEGVTIWPYGPKEGKPQFIIKDFKLSKKELNSREKVYVVSLQLIKRENVERPS